jgi:hypothetical protein
MSMTTEPARHGFAITPADTDFTQPTRGIWVGTGGDLVVRFEADGSTPTTITAVPSGTFLPFSLKRVAAATTAEDLVGVW